MEKQVGVRVPTNLNRQIALLAGPLVLQNVSQTMLGVADTFFVSRISTAALAAVGLSSVMFFAVLMLFRGTAESTVIFVGRAHGEGDSAKIGASIWHSLNMVAWLSLAVLTLPCSVTFTLDKTALAATSDKVPGWVEWDSHINHSTSQRGPSDEQQPAGLSYRIHATGRSDAGRTLHAAAQLGIAGYSAVSGEQLCAHALGRPSARERQQRQPRATLATFSDEQAHRRARELWCGGPVALEPNGQRAHRVDTRPHDARQLSEHLECEHCLPRTQLAAGLEGHEETRANATLSS